MAHRGNGDQAVVGAILPAWGGFAGGNVHQLVLQLRARRHPDGRPPDIALLPARFWNLGACPTKPEQLLRLAINDPNGTNCSSKGRAVA